MEGSKVVFVKYLLQYRLTGSRIPFPDSMQQRLMPFLTAHLQNFRLLLIVFNSQHARTANGSIQYSVASMVLRYRYWQFLPTSEQDC